MNFAIRDLAAGDRGFALSSWRESHKSAPGVDKVPWSFYKSQYGTIMGHIVNSPTTTLLGAYDDTERLLGWLAMTRLPRVDSLHWVYVKHKLGDEKLRRRGLMTALVDAAKIRPRFVYTLRGARRRIALPDGSKTKSLDEALVAWFHARGETATYVPLLEWAK